VNKISQDKWWTVMGGGRAMIWDRVVRGSLSREITFARDPNNEKVLAMWRFWERGNSWCKGTGLENLGVQK